jgi:hypothetical protein
MRYPLQIMKEEIDPSIRLLTVSSIRNLEESLKMVATDDAFGTRELEAPA